MPNLLTANEANVHEDTLIRIGVAHAETFFAYAEVEQELSGTLLLVAEALDGPLDGITRALGRHALKPKAWPDSPHVLWYMPVLEQGTWLLRLLLNGREQARRMIIVE
jgi:hypothetical protein